MAKDLQAKIHSLGQRLKEECNSKSPDLPETESEKTKPPTRALLGLNISSGTRKQRPANLSVDGSFKPRRRIVHARRHSNKDDDSAHIEKKLNEINKQTGILKLGDKKYEFSLDDLDTEEEIGCGTSGQVFKMRHKKSGQVMAVKKMARSHNKEEQKRVLMDLEVVMKSHDCPYIVNCIGCYISRSDVFICMELMTTCLDKLIKRLQGPIPEHILGKMAVAIVNALHYLKEKHGVMHRDVKPSNMLLDCNGCVKLCDFSISGRLVDSKAKTKGAGCAAYLAPERIDPPDPMHPDYDVRADVWSLGLSLVELATGKFPYRDCTTEFEVLSRVMNEDPPCLPSEQGFSEEFCSFVSECLIKDYQYRPKYDKLLKHPFIQHYEKADVDVACWLKDKTVS
ncbi:dual specificity mitogen-activated protein kinase kinase 7-like [Actinia tenebrosa]|uniref:mitogen-activated protein kinase kinase n=1 Tax=Actinia tenebrosa TaxID=6105 RepID=A0A6P8JBD4_ACTTE|nr:dual specificity mitogen-activated protein kinase kinase 7-like [Actinia tenebrosa]